ncbi:hypothetical protein EV175_005902, partial [Coemansia sp. RSA 1933]
TQQARKINYAEYVDFNPSVSQNRFSQHMPPSPFYHADTSGVRASSSSAGVPAQNQQQQQQQPGIVRHAQLHDASLLHELDEA